MDRMTGFEPVDGSSILSGGTGIIKTVSRESNAGVRDFQ